MNKPKESKLHSLVKELAKNVKSQKDLSDLTRELVKWTVETALNAEMEAHLGHTRKAVNQRKLFSNDPSAMKVVYLAVDAASKKWTMPIRNWKAAMNRFMIEFPDRVPADL